MLLHVNGISFLQALTQCDLSETAAPAPVAMGASKFLYRPATKAIRSHVEQARLSYEPKVRVRESCSPSQGPRAQPCRRGAGKTVQCRAPLQRYGCIYAIVVVVTYHISSVV